MKNDAPHGSLSLAWSDAAQVVDDVPHLLWGHLAVVALHVVLRADAVLDHLKDFLVTRSVIPLVVGQIRWVSPLGRLRAIALGVFTVTEAAVLGEERFAAGNGLRCGRNRILS